jgi:hypothetical protein
VHTGYRTSKKNVESPQNPKNCPVGGARGGDVQRVQKSRSNPSSRVLHLPLHLLPLEPLTDAIMVDGGAAAPRVKGNYAFTSHGASSNKKDN